MILNLLVCVLFSYASFAQGGGPGNSSVECTFKTGDGFAGRRAPSRSAIVTALLKKGYVYDQNSTNVLSMTFGECATRVSFRPSALLEGLQKVERCKFLVELKNSKGETINHGNGVRKQHADAGMQPFYFSSDSPEIETTKALGRFKQCPSTENESDSD